jgi:hypothetical protein
MGNNFVKLVWSVSRESVRFSVRWCVALLGLICGWLINFSMYVFLAPGASGPDRESWGYWSGFFCIVAWLFVGLPLAALDWDVYSNARRIVAATVICGFIGVVMIAPFLGISLTFSGLAFLTAAASMFVYAVVRRLSLGFLKPAPSR